MNANIGLTDEQKKQSALILNHILSDEFLLYTKARNYHWNVEGSNFMEMHSFYQKMYEEWEEVIDEVAERIRMLGHYAEGRMKDFLQLTNLLEEDYSNNQKTQLETLLSDHETIIRQLRKNVEEFEKLNDQGNMDFATGLLEKHEKWAWFVRSYLK